ncbi:MAG: DEAD/DEAH box helicase [Pseudomonadota bacterium]|nr:DEAD/DEAH box helicase [Pseudomonadota bacterium]
MTDSIITFEELGLSAPVLSAVKRQGYEQPTPVQAATIPVMLSGQDMVALANTGTGKTGAFALPILSQIDVSKAEPQALILAPTRELAIQVAEAFHQYAKDMPGFHVLPVYGGKNYLTQLKSLNRGVHVIVGTPGRTLDHLSRGSLKLNAIRFVVLDEADEMLNMGFHEDVQAILKQIHGKHQTVLFSATMSPDIRGIADTHLKNPQKIQIKSKTATVANTEQSCIIVSKEYKLEALTRYLEVEEYDGVLIFCRTKLGTQEVADKLQARGYAVSAMNGDMSQDAREAVIRGIKNKKYDIIVATEVAARGLDVVRISHVINYDLPQEVSSYIHRIGRTGRAGRMGKALLLATPRERRMLAAIEQATKQPIKIIEPPTARQVTSKRSEQFKQTLLGALESKDLSEFRLLANEIANESNIPLADIAAAAMVLSAKAKSLPALGGSDKFIHASDAVEPKRKRPGGFGDKKFGKKPPFAKAGEKKFYGKKDSTGAKPKFKQKDKR